MPLSRHPACVTAGLLLAALIATTAPAGLIAAAPPVADAGTPPRSTLADRLARPDPATLQELRAYGTSVDLQLIDVARDTQRSLAQRRAATRALGLVATRTARDYLGRLIAAGGTDRHEQDVALVRTAVLALGTMRDEAALDLLVPLLGHRDPDVRLDAVAAIAGARLPSSIDILESYLRAEKDARLRRKAEKQLRVLRQALPRPPAPTPPAPRVTRPRPISERTDPNRPPERGP